MSVLLQGSRLVLAVVGSLLFSVVGIPTSDPVPAIVGYTAILTLGLGLFAYGRLLGTSDDESDGNR